MGIVRVRDRRSPTGFIMIQAGGGQRITWGDPAQITQCRIDRQCPRCGALPAKREYGKSKVSTQKTRLIAGIEIGKDYAFCVCSWGYEID